MLHYIEGPNNILADNFYRIQRLISLAQLAEVQKFIDLVVVSDDEDADDTYFLYLEFSGLIDNEINDALECFINLPQSDAPEQNPLVYKYILEQQQDD